MMTDNPIEQFRDAIQASGLTPPDSIEADGKLRRFASNGRRNDDAGWYLLHGDGIPCGSFGDWRTGLTQSWRADIGRSLTPIEETTHRARVEATRRERETDEARRQAEATKNSAAIWRAATTATAANPYLKRKGVSPVATLREIDVAEAAAILGYSPKSKGAPLTGRLLVAPVKVGATLSTLELIDGDGHKSALYGGAKIGGYWAAQSLPDSDGPEPLQIFEGVATTLSGKEANGYLSVAALSSGNLIAMATIMRERYPTRPLVIGADLLKATGEPDPHAIEAARSVGGTLAIPDFGADRPDDAKDFNDMAQLCGLEAVKRSISGAPALARTEDQVGGESRPAADSASPAWPEPQPLPRLPKVPDFPLDLLPDDLVDYVRDASERARFRPDFAAVAIMAALGSVIGRKIGIRLKRCDDWTEYANVWAAMIGPPSALKSPAERAAMRPFKKLQVAADDLHRQQRAEHDLKAEAFKLRKDAKRKKVVEALAKDSSTAVDLGDEKLPAAPVARAYWTSEPTAEKLGVMLAENPHGLLVERDELSSLLVKLEDDRNATLRGLYLSGWSGNEGYRFDSISRGTTALPKFALSVAGGMQPGPLSRYVRSAYSGERADGLLQRFQLIVWPDSEPFALVDRFPNRDARTAVDALFERADSFDPIAMGQTDGFGNDPPFVRLSGEAQGHFNEWYVNFMQNRRSVEASADESGPVSAHFGKYPGLVGKLALIIHVADDPAGTEVSERTILKALAWIDYLTPHAQRVYHAAEHPETGAAELLLARMRRGELPDTFKAWEISRKGWHGLADREAVKKACRLLFEFGWLIEIQEGGVSNGGRPGDPVYAASPAVKP